MSLILKYDLGNPHRLPVGYTPLAYIESTGTLYIDTGWVPGIDSKIDTTIIPSDNSALSSTNPITCIYTSDNKLIFEYFIHKNEQTLYYSVNGVLGASTNGNKSVSDGKFIGPLHCVYTTDKFICNGETLVSSSKPTIETSYNCYIFAHNNKGTIDSRHIACKLYSFKGFDNNTLVRDFIPARRNSDGIIGLFDCISQTFFTNQGTGEFIAGPEIVVLPYEYLQVECLESTGTLYIITNFIPDDTSGMYVKASCSTTGGDHVVGGSRESSGDTRFWINFSSRLEFSWNTYESVYSYDSSVLEIENNYLNSRLGKVNGTTYRTNYPTLATITQPCYLFCSNRIGAVANPFSGKIFNVKFSKNSTITHNFIPCYRRSDLKPGMYDTVNNVFYTNSGSGEFILGPVVEESSRQLEYNNAGSNYIGIPKNVHHSTSNPSSTLINWGSGKFIRSEKSMITTGALGISGDANFSICAWVKTVDAIANFVGVVANSTYTPGKCFGLLLYSNRPDLDFWTDGDTDGGSRFIATNAISSGEWHHIVATKAAGVPSTSNCKLYVDGIAVSGSVVGSQAPNITNSPIIIGRLNNTNNRYFNGEIYDVRIYDNVLTADEVLNIYKKGL